MPTETALPEGDPATEKRARRLLFVALFNSMLGLSVLFPILAPLGRSLSLSEVEVGALSTSYALMQFLMGAFWGRQSDRRGRRPILLMGIIGFSISFFLFGIVADIGRRGGLEHVPLLLLLLGSRLLGGTFSSATLPTAQAYIADVTARANRTSGMALVGAAFGLGIIFGPAIGAGLATIDLLLPVYFSAGLAAVNALFVAIRLPEPRRQEQRTESTGRKILAHVWPLLAVGLTATLASVAMEQTVAFFFQDRLGLDATGTARSVGIALVAYGIVAVFVQGYLVRRSTWTPLRLLWGGLPIAFLGFVIFVFADSFMTLTLALCVQGFGQGLILPAVTAAGSLAVGDEEQGTVAGLNNAAQGLGRMAGPLIGTGLYEFHAELPYAFSAGLLVLAFLFLIGSRAGRLAGRRPSAAPTNGS